MEIKRLELLVTDQDLQDLAREQLPKEVAFEDLQIHIEPAGVRIKGVYHMFVPVSFEMLWEMGVDQGNATAKLASFRTMGMPGNVLKSLIMNVVADTAKDEPWLQVKGDTVRADVDGLLKRLGVNLRTRLTAIRCLDGQLAVEAGM
jgi:hypothetical protein